ncbi:hypothetical protein P154DRAFT_433400, partial [Amniculicola lignicola CBS 123094]
LPVLMNYYYNCPIDELRRELQRRGLSPVGSRDSLSETLLQDDERRGVAAVSVSTTGKVYKYPTPDSGRVRFSSSVHPETIVGEKIIFWTMNTFFNSLQIFFESGRSCTIDGGNLAIGLDSDLRYRLTDLTHEENGIMVKGVFPEKPRLPTPSITIVDAVVAERTTITVQPSMLLSNIKTRFQPTSQLTQTVHTVVGLRLKGMSDIGYVWASSEPRISASNVNTLSTRVNWNRHWGDTTLTGLRNDVPVPRWGFPQQHPKPGDKVVVVRKGSMIKY